MESAPLSIRWETTWRLEPASARGCKTSASSTLIGTHRQWQDASATSADSGRTAAWRCALVRTIPAPPLSLTTPSYSLSLQMALTAGPTRSRENSGCSLQDSAPRSLSQPSTQPRCCASWRSNRWATLKMLRASVPLRTSQGKVIHSWYESTSLLHSTTTSRTIFGTTTETLRWILSRVP